MGKNLIQQARGKGSPTYRAPSFRYAGKIKHCKPSQEVVNGEIKDLIKCQGHSAPLASIKYQNGFETLLPAVEGIRVGDKVSLGSDNVIPGNVIELKNIPEGTLINNIELQPGDGGKFVRSSGTFGKIVTKMPGKVVVLLPSKREKTFNPNCRATIGVIAGGGRLEKPFLKAGKKFFYMKARNKLWPKVSGGAQNAVDHPFGNKRTSRKSKARPCPRNAPPGRKVGMIAARRTGRRKK